MPRRSETLACRDVEIERGGGRDLFSSRLLRGVRVGLIENSLREAVEQRYVGVGGLIFLGHACTPCTVVPSSIKHTTVCAVNKR